MVYLGTNLSVLHVREWFHTAKQLLIATFCRIRRSTWDKLLALSKGSKSLGALLKERTSVDFVAPVLTDEHFEAVNRRLENAINLINKCISKRGESVVLTKDYL